ncbi:MAG: hypothetical protein ACI8S6_005884 [Myxococcota bacterium]|jgi:hypothetical protein
MEEQSTGGGAAFKVLGAGCSGMGCLMMVSAVALFGLLLAEFFNSSMEEQVLAGGGTSLCCGISALLFGIVLIMVGRSRS